MTALQLSERRTSLFECSFLAALSAGATSIALACSPTVREALTQPNSSSPANQGGSSNGTKSVAGNNSNTGGSSGNASGGSNMASSKTSPVAAPSSIPTQLRTLNTAQYITAAADGALTAASATASEAETFALTDVNAGALEAGDDVFLAATNGKYLTAADGGGATLSAIALRPGNNETFQVIRLAGSGTIVSGDLIALKTKFKTNYVSALNGGGASVTADAPWAREWETFRLTLNGVEPTQPQESADRKMVLDYLRSLSGKKTIAGQHNKINATPSSATDWVRGNTGKQPGLWSGDFLFGKDALDNRGKMIAEAINQWNLGALVQVMYHSCSPSRDENCEWDDVGGANPQHLTDEQWTQLVTAGTDLNKAWLARLDVLSVHFKTMKDAGVVPLFRPLHEMNQSVFWWGGRKGSKGTLKLYQITHDYLVNTKGFDNIIWVWDIQDFGSLPTDAYDYNPGPDYYDIAALDVYDGGYTDSKYSTMLSAAPNKLIAIGECEHLPTAEELVLQPRWSFFMLWPDFTEENADILPSLYAANNVLTLEEMPGWR